MFRTEDEEEYGYMRGQWDNMQTQGACAGAGEEGGQDMVGRVCRTYDTLEEMKEDKGVYKAVRAAIRATHQQDGMTVEQVLGETAAQRELGRIRYLVVAEERGGRG